MAESDFGPDLFDPKAHVCFFSFAVLLLGSEKMWIHWNP